MTSTGPLADYILYNPAPVPTATPNPANGNIGKIGTKFWGSYLQNIAMPAGIDGEERSVCLTNVASMGNAWDSQYRKVSIGFFGSNSRLTTTGATAYMTLKIYAATNPGTDPNKSYSINAHL